MKKLFTLLMMLGLCISVSAQIAPDKYWIQFADKNNSPYSIDRPEEFLSERSIQRRVDYGIAIDSYDIPVNPSYLQAVADCGAEILHPSKWLNGVTVIANSSSVISAIEALPFVQTTRSIENDELKQMIKEKTYFSNETLKPIDAKSVQDNDYGMALPQIEQLNGVALHERGYQGQGMWIGICDGGYLDVDGHEAFADMRDKGRLLGTRDYVYKNGIVYTDSSEDCGCTCRRAFGSQHRGVFSRLPRRSCSRTRLRSRHETPPARRWQRTSRIRSSCSSPPAICRNG